MKISKFLREAPMKFMPAIFVNHGGGPLPLLGDPGHVKLAKYLSSSAKSFPNPIAILIASAHWETPVTSFVGSNDPGLLYDYYGFPRESYEISYPIRNSLEILKKAQQMLEQAGIPSKVDSRPYDHGVFVPLKLMYPSASVPVIQISLPSSRNPAFVIQLGQALRPLREQGVLLIGSGMSFHNLPAFFSDEDGKASRSQAFDRALQDAMKSQDRLSKLKFWESFPHARYCHPNEDHLMPLLFVAGAAYPDEACNVVYEDTLMGAKITGFAFISNNHEEL